MWRTNCDILCGQRGNGLAADGQAADAELVGPGQQVPPGRSTPGRPPRAPVPRGRSRRTAARCRSTGRGPCGIRFLILPASLPAYVAGIKQGWAFAWRSLMAPAHPPPPGELVVSIIGQFSIGQRLDVYQPNLDFAGATATIIVILVIGIVVDTIFTKTDQAARPQRGGTPRVLTASGRWAVPGLGLQPRQVLVEDRRWAAGFGPGGPGTRTGARTAWPPPGNCRLRRRGVRAGRRRYPGKPAG
jgi:hypothetical protein